MKPTSRQKEVFDLVNDVAKSRGISTTMALKETKTSPSVYYSAKKRIGEDKQDAAKPKRAYKKRAAARKPYTRKTEVFDIPLADTKQEKVMLFVGSVAEISAILSTMR